jgi:hypothetical protein
MPIRTLLFYYIPILRKNINILYSLLKKTYGWLYQAMTDLSKALRKEPSSGYRRCWEERDMRLESFTVKNFRSITNAYRLPLRDFAVRVGPNTSGKSNILKAIVMALGILSRGCSVENLRSLAYL